MSTAVEARKSEGSQALEGLALPPRRAASSVGTGYFDDVANVIAAGQASATVLADSTESARFL